MDISQFNGGLMMVILIAFLQGALSFSEDQFEDESPSWGRCPWIRNKLKNGRVKLRSRGRIAKFLCDPGYELAGKRFVTCVKGQWNNPIPVCVSRGCSKLPDIANGRVTEMYRGALLVYDCQPGYTLDGGISVYCDGRRWSSVPPSCVVSNPDPKPSCDFEDSDLCGWSHDPTHDFNWKRNQFATPSGHVGTGPSFDHTFGTGKGGFYLYIEASSPRRVNDTSRLFSPVYPQDNSGGCFFFWYHMYGSTTGGLRVYIKPESHVFGEASPAWEKFGDQGNQWFRGNVSVPLLSENFQIIIEGIRGTSYLGDTAIDDVNLTTADCENAGNITESVAETGTDSCRGRCRDLGDANSCGCNDNCYVSVNCCQDYLTMCNAGNETSEGENPEERVSGAGDDLGTTSILVTMTKSTSTQSPPSHYNYDQTDAMNTTRAVMYTSTPVISPIVWSTVNLVTGKSTIPSTTAAIATSTTSSITASTSTIMSPSSTTTTTTTPSTTAVPTTTSSTTTTTTTRPSMTTSSTTTSSITKSTTVKPSTPSTVTITSKTSPSSTAATSLSTQRSTTLTATTPMIIPLFTVTGSTIQTTTRSPLTTKAPLFTTPEITRKTYNLRPRTSRTYPTSSSNPTSTSKIVYNSSPYLTTPRNMFTTARKRFESTTLTTQSSNSPDAKVTTTMSFRSSDIYSSPHAVPFTMLTTNPLIKGIGSSTSMSRVVTSGIKLSSSTSIATTTVSSVKISSIATERPTPLTMSPKSNQATSTKTTRLFEHSSRTTTNNPGYTVLPTRPTEEYIYVQSSPAQSLENHASKSAATASDDSRPTVTIIAVAVVIIIGLVAGIIYYRRRLKAKKQSKLADDSEMRFLSDNEVIEYADSSVLDKIMVN